MGGRFEYVGVWTGPVEKARRASILVRDTDRLLQRMAESAPPGGAGVRRQPRRTGTPESKPVAG